MSIYTVTTNVDHSCFPKVEKFNDPHTAACYFNEVATFSNFMASYEGDGNILHIEFHKNGELVCCKGFYMGDDPEEADAKAPKVVSF